MKNFIILLIFLACHSLYSANEEEEYLLLDPPLRLNGHKVQKAFGKIQQIVLNSTVKLIRNDKLIAHGTIVHRDGFVISKASDCIGASSLVTHDDLSYPVKVRKRSESCDLVLLEITHNQANWPFISFTENNDSLDARWAISASSDLSDLRIGIFGANSREIGREGGVMGVVLSDESEGQAGVLVADIIPHSAADRAGLKTGDRILKVERRTINSKQQINQTMQKKDPGDLVLLQISRANKIQDIRVTLGHRSVTFDLFNRNLLMSGPVSKRKDNFPLIHQHDIPMDHNNMGGPVFRADGKCVGINIARVDRVTNYAIPSFLVKSILADWFEN